MWGPVLHKASWEGRDLVLPKSSKMSRRDADVRVRKSRARLSALPRNAANVGGLVALLALPVVAGKRMARSMRSSRGELVCKGCVCQGMPPGVTSVQVGRYLWDSVME